MPGPPQSRGILELSLSHVILAVLGVAQSWIETYSIVSSLCFNHNPVAVMLVPLHFLVPIFYFIKWRCVYHKTLPALSK